MTERLMTECRVLWHYISLFYFPASHRFSLLYDYPLSRSLFSPPSTFFSILAWGILIFFAWFYRRKYRVFSWMIAWFLISHLIESTVLPLEIIFEHRMYLPTLGLAYGSVLITYDFFRTRRIHPAIRVLILLLLSVLLLSSTYIRNLDYRNAVTLYRSELNKFPHSKRILLNLSISLIRSGNFSEGGNILRKLSEKYSNDIIILQNFYNYLVFNEKNDDLAERIYQNILTCIREGYYNSYTDANALEQLAIYFRETGKYERAIFLIDFLIAYFQQNSRLWYLKGHCFAGSGDWKSAADSFRRAADISPKDGEMIYWYGTSLVRSGETEEGCRILKKFVSSSDDKNLTEMAKKWLNTACVMSDIQE
ncbi:MAG: tetratricopeptide repeat protein [Desulfococcaceae bacterium]